MGIFATDLDLDLEQYKKTAVPTERVCPTCAKPFTGGAQTLTAVNKELGMESHKCPHCGAEFFARMASPTG